MKLKGKCYGYLGHFKQSKYLKKGHNDSGKMELSEDERERRRELDKYTSEFSAGDVKHAEKRAHEAPESLSGAEWEALGIQRDSKKSR